MNPGILQKLSLIITINSKAALAKIKQIQARFAAFSKAAIAKLRMIGIAAALVFAGFAASAVVAGTAFEFMMTKVAAISGATADEMVRLTNTARIMGATTAFTATEAASGLLDLARSGMTAANQIETLKDVLHLAGGAGEDMAIAANLVAATMKQFNLAASESTRIADVFSSVLDKTLFQSLQEIQVAMGRAGTTAATFGISLEKITSLSGALRNVGVDASMVGTQIRMAFLKLANPIGRAVSVLAKYGLTAQDVNPRLNEIGDILQKLADSGMVAEEMFKVLGVRQSGFVNVVKQVRNGVNDYTRLLDELSNSAGRAENKYAQMMDTIQGRMKIMKSAFQEAQLSLFDALEPMLKKFTSVGKRLMDSLADSIKNNRDRITEFAEGALRALVSFGKFIAMFGDAFIFVGKVMAIMVILKIAIAAVGIVIGVVFSPAGLLIGGILLFLKFKEPIIDFFQTFMAWSQTASSSFYENNKEAIDIVTAIYKAYFNFLIKQFVFFGKVLALTGKLIWDNIGGIWNAIMVHWIQPWVDKFVAVMKFIGDIVGTVFDSLKEKIDKLFKDKPKAETPDIGSIEKYFDDIKIAAKETWETDYVGMIFNAAESGGKFIVDKSKAAIDKVKAMLAELRTGSIDIFEMTPTGVDAQGLLSEESIKIGEARRKRAEASERQRQSAKQFGFGAGAGLIAEIVEIEENLSAIEQIRQDFATKDIDFQAATLDTKNQMLDVYLEKVKDHYQQQGMLATAAFGLMEGAAGGFYNASEKMAKSFFNNENRRQKVLLILAKQTAMGASAAALESIGEILKAKAKFWAIEAAAMFWEGNFASAAGLAAAALAAGAGSAIAFGGAGAIRERMDRELAAATQTPRPLTTGEREGGVVVPQGGSSPGGQGGQGMNITVEFNAETQVFSEEGVEGIKLALKQDVLENVKEFMDSGQI